MESLSAEWRGKSGASGLSAAEIRVMDVVWQENGTSARFVASTLSQKFGYSASATYTLINRCIKKGALTRTDPGYYCTPLLTREEVQDAQADSMLDRLFEGDPVEFVAAQIRRGRLTDEQLASLRSLIDDASA